MRSRVKHLVSSVCIFIFMCIYVYVYVCMCDPKKRLFCTLPVIIHHKSCIMLALKIYISPKMSSIASEPPIER